MNTARNRWYVLGFRYEEVVEAMQDARLAYACVAAWQTEPGTPEPQVLWTLGEGDSMYNWFVDDDTAALLDRHGVCWRHLVVGQCDAPPRDATSALRTPLRQPLPPAP